MVGKCPGCGWSPKTGKTRDLNKHMDLTRNRPCLAILQLSRNTQPIINSNLQSQDPNARKPNESVNQWGSRLRKKKSKNQVTRIVVSQKIWPKPEGFSY